MQDRERVDRQLLDTQALVGAFGAGGEHVRVPGRAPRVSLSLMGFADLFPSGKGPTVGPGECDGFGDGAPRWPPSRPESLAFPSTFRLRL